MTFADANHAREFLSNREHVIDGKRVEAKSAVPRSEGNVGRGSTKIFVGGTVRQAG